MAVSAQAPGGLVEVNGWVVSDRRDTDGRYVGCTAFFLFDDEVAVGFARDRGEEDVFAVERLKARLTEDSAYPVWLKVDDGETLVIEGAALDKDADRPFFRTPRGCSRNSRGRHLVEAHQKTAGSG